jgi:hypothetical protein
MISISPTQKFGSEPHGGLAGQEAFAEIAVQRVAHEGEVLPPHRLIEAERDAHGLAFDLARIGADHHRHRVADHVDAGEHHRRHHHHDQRGLHQATDDVDEHGYSCRTAGLQARS